MAGRPSKRQIAYNQEIQDLLNNFRSSLLGYSQKIKDTLIDARDRFVGRLWAMPKGVWKTHHYERIRKELQGVLSRFDREYAVLLARAMDESAKEGINFVISPLKNNIKLATAPSIFQPAFTDPFTRETFNLAQTMIKGAAGAAEQEIMSHVFVNMAGAEGDAATIRKITDVLTGQLGGDAAGFKNLNRRSWAIFRTETIKLHNISAQIQMRRANEIFPGSQKTWHHGMMLGLGQHPRPGHVALDGVTIDFKERFENPVTGATLEYPHDPMAGAEEVVYCSCSHSLKMPDEIFLRDRTMVLTERIAV